MVDFAHETDANGSGVSALREHINAIAASIPAANAGAMPELGAADAQAGTAGVGNAAPSPTIEQVGARRFGLWDLGSNVLRLQSKLSTIDEVDRRTEALQQTFTQIRAMPEQQIKALSARGDELGARSAGSDAAELKAARDEYDTIAWLFAANVLDSRAPDQSRRAARAVPRQSRQLARLRRGRSIDRL